MTENKYYLINYEKFYKTVKFKNIEENYINFIDKNNTIIKIPNSKIHRIKELDININLGNILKLDSIGREIINKNKTLIIKKIFIDSDIKPDDGKGRYRYIIEVKAMKKNVKKYVTPSTCYNILGFKRRDIENIMEYIRKIGL